MADNSMIEIVTIDNIPVQLDSEDILKKLHMDKKKTVKNDIQELIDLAKSIMAPRAIYGIAYISDKGRDTVSVNTTTFTSHVLSTNLASVGRFFPYVVTIGKELEEKCKSMKLLKQYCLEEIGNITLRTARKYLEDYLKSEYKLTLLSSMSPGRLADWPLSEQKLLFSLLGDVEELLGVSLTDSMMMIPRKSVSGLYFPTELHFESCQLCPRERCEGRKAPYDAELVKSYSTSTG